VHASPVEQAAELRLPAHSERTQKLPVRGSPVSLLIVRPWSSKSTS